MPDTREPQGANNVFPVAAPRQPLADVLIVGGGIAGSTAAAVLANAGLTVRVFDPAPVHEHHMAAALTPVISSDDNVRSRLSRLGAQLAARWWRPLGEAVAQPCGAIQLQRPDGAKRVTDLKAQAQAFAQPDWARWVECDQASELAGLPMPRGGIWYPGAWLVRVPRLINALQSRAHVVVNRVAVDRIESTSAGWMAFDQAGDLRGQAKVVVLANAFDTLGLLQRSGLTEALAACDRLPAMHRLAGEITALPATILAGGPRCIVGGDGYVLPSVDGWCVSGGTYVRQANQAACSSAGRRANVARASELLGMRVACSDDASLPGWAGWRAVLPGRLPAMGPLPKKPDLWINTAGASRGLTWSVLGASLIRDQMLGRADQWDAAMIDAVRP